MSEIHYPPARPFTPLPGTPKRSGALRKCDKHGDITPPEGGVQVSANKWYCASCWAIFSPSRRRLV